VKRVEQKDAGVGALAPRGEGSSDRLVPCHRLIQQYSITRAPFRERVRLLQDPPEATLFWGKFSEARPSFLVRPHEGPYYYDSVYAHHPP
jgi:hypothetical protein